MELRPTSQEYKQGGRARLLTAARELFGAAGFGAVSVAQILQSSELKAPSLYHHYGDKEGLYVAWAKEALEDIRSRVVQAEDETNAPFDRLRHFARILAIDHAVDVLQVERDIRMLKSAAAAREIENALLESIITPVRTAFLEGMALGQVRRQDPQLLARAFIHGVMTFHPAYFRESSGVSASVDWYVQMIWDGASSDAASRRL